MPWPSRKEGRATTTAIDLLIANSETYGSAGGVRSIQRPGTGVSGNKRAQRATNPHLSIMWTSGLCGPCPPKPVLLRGFDRSEFG
jgi:hypothetical protein